MDNDIKKLLEKDLELEKKHFLPIPERFMIYSKK